MKEAGTTTSRSLQRLRGELNRVVRLHDVTIFAYQQGQDRIRERLKAKEIFGSTELYSEEHDGERRLLARSPHELTSRMANQFPRILRESLLVRVVSQFEVFLTDCVREIAGQTLAPFFQQDRILRYPQAKLLAFASLAEIHDEVIEQECRQITGQGFLYAKKYYRKRFKIHFDRSDVPLEDVEEILERRHLIVHRNGKADNKYLKRFNPALKVGKTLNVDAEYLLTAVKYFRDLATYIDDCVGQEIGWNDIKKKRVQGEERSAFPGDPFSDIPLKVRWKAYITARHRELSEDDLLACWLEIEFKSMEQREKFLNLNRRFQVEGKRYTVGQIVFGGRLQARKKAELIILGPKSVVGPFYGRYRIMARRDEFDDYNSVVLINGTRVNLDWHES